MGNVLAVVSDRKLGQLLYDYTYSAGAGSFSYNSQSNEFIYTGSGSNYIQGSNTSERNFDSYLPEVLSYSDYYPFHMQMPDRFDNSNPYRYGGANGQEKELEVTGGNSHYSAEYWMYDSRTGRRWNVDPEYKSMTNRSSYSTYNNAPLLFEDPNGDFPWIIPIVIAWWVSTPTPGTAPPVVWTEADQRRTEQAKEGVGRWITAPTKSAAGFLWNAYSELSSQGDDNRSAADKMLDNTSASTMTQSNVVKNSSSSSTKTSTSSNTGSNGSKKTTVVKKTTSTNTVTNSVKGTWMEKALEDSGSDKKVSTATTNRVKLRKDVVEKVKEKAEKTKDGKFIDPNTKKPIEGKFDIGHIAGEEWAKRKKMHEAAGSTRKEVIEAENNPELYQIEDRSSNRSHKFEQKKQ